MATNPFQKADSASSITRPPSGGEPGTDSVFRGIAYACAGMVVLAYNLPGVEELALSREAIEGIFSGQIKNWQDERIAATNPDLDLPKRTITPVVRRDSSGTTFIITSHLAEAFPAWRDGPGVGKQIDWPGSTILGSAPEVPDDLRVFVPDPPGADAYPIVGYTWLLLYQQYPDAERRIALKDAILWGLTEGQPIAEEMGYISLPADMVRLARAKVDAIQ